MILSSEPFRLVLYLVGIMSFVGLNAAYLVWVERKGAARFQRRPGPNEVGFAGLLQPIADAVKLLSKQLIVPAGVDRTLFRLSPLVVMAPALIGLAVVPFGQSLNALNLNIGLLLVFACAKVLTEEISGAIGANSMELADTLRNLRRCIDPINFYSDICVFLVCSRMLFNWRVIAVFFLRVALLSAALF